MISPVDPSKRELCELLNRYFTLVVRCSKNISIRSVNAIMSPYPFLPQHAGSDKLVYCTLYKNDFLPLKNCKAETVPYIVAEFTFRYKGNKDPIAVGIFIEGPVSNRETAVYLSPYEPAPAKYPSPSLFAQK